MNDGTQTPVLEMPAATPHPLAGEVDAALRGAVFPLLRDELVWIARENEAPRMLVSLMSALPDQRYGSQDAVVRLLEERPG